MMNCCVNHEIGNTNDTHAIAIKKDIGGVRTTVGHIARDIKKIYIHSVQILRQGGTILCEVNGHRQTYRKDK